MSLFAKSAFLIAAGVIISGLTTLTASAANPAYVGTWATSAKKCKLPSDTLDAPVVMSRMAYNQFETHCDFKSLKMVRGGWKARVVCLVEGAKEKDTLTIRASAKTMSIKWGVFPGTLNYVRCK
jgi:hypothetical protein